MKTVKLDIDNYEEHELKLLELCSFIPYPIWIRHSASMKGLHIKFNCSCDNEKECYECPIYAHDDQIRLLFNKIRKNSGLSHNVLWKVKRGKKAEEWHEINSIRDLFNFFNLPIRIT